MTPSLCINKRQQQKYTIYDPNYDKRHEWNSLMISIVIDYLTNHGVDAWFSYELIKISTSLYTDELWKCTTGLLSWTTWSFKDKLLKQANI